MKKYILLAFVLIFSLSSCAQLQSGELKQYKTPFGFLVECPDEYQVKDADESIFRVFKDIQNPESPRFSIMLSDFTSEEMSGLTKEAMIEIIERSYKTSKAYTFESKTTDNNIPLVSIDTEIEDDDGYKVLLKQAYFSIDDKVYLFLATMEESDLSSLEEFTSILHSIELIHK